MTGEEAIFRGMAMEGSCRDCSVHLKSSFYRLVLQGRFADPTSQWYVCWLEKDDSIHCDNVVTPAIVMVVDYGLFDDPARHEESLVRRKAGMQKQNRLSLPLCFVFYSADGGSAGSNVCADENGDLLLPWGELGVRPYTSCHLVLSLYYYVNIALDRYENDGQSYKRYLRRDQPCEVDDVLVENGMAIAWLYRDIYGILSKRNSTFLKPRRAVELNGTKLRYTSRGYLCRIELSSSGSAITSSRYVLNNSHPSGINGTAARLEYFSATHADWAISISLPASQPLTIRLTSWLINLDVSRPWTETARRAKGTTVRVVIHFLANAT
jgi:hypothetical protein